MLAYNIEDCETPEDHADRAAFLLLIRESRLRALRHILDFCEYRCSPRSQNKFTSDAISGTSNTHATVSALHMDVHSIQRNYLTVTHPSSPPTEPDASGPIATSNPASEKLI